MVWLGQVRRTKVPGGWLMPRSVLGEVEGAEGKKDTYGWSLLGISNTVGIVSL